MENGRENSSSLSNTSKEASARKKRKGSSKKSGKSSSSKASSLKHSEKPSAHGDSHLDAGTAAESERAAVEVELASELEVAGASGELPLKRNNHSKSRSRSSSRSRFSGFFKRKKRSKSETDLGQMLKDKIGNGQESPSCTDVSQDKAKTNLKSVSPHHAFDSRVRPRDRLMNMTVRDAVKEQRLRRVHSAGRSSHRHGIDQEDVGSITGSQFESSGATPKTNRHSPERKEYTSSTLPRPSKGSILSSDPERSAFYKYPSNPELKKQMAGLSGSTNSKEFTSLAVNAPSSSPDCSSFSSRDGEMGESPTAEIDLDDFVIDYGSKLGIDSRADSQNDGEDAKTLVNVSISSQEDDFTDSFKQTNFPDKTVEAQRKASLTKFLELRQHPPPSLARHQWGALGYDPVAVREHAQGQSYKAHDAQIGHDVSIQENKAALPPVQETSSDISIPVLAAPRLSLNGEDVETYELCTPTPVIRPTSIFLEDSAVDSSSLSSSPQINSMASSFRSSDQGYAESDGDSSDDNSAFSTPPEESERVHSNQLTATVLKKLLDPVKEKQKGIFQVIDSDVGVIEGIRYPNRKQEQIKAKSDSGNETVPTGLLSSQRYIPRGVRRSKSDISSRQRPYRRYFRNASSPPVKSKLGAEERNSPLVTPTASEAGDSLSAVSACTLTGTDSFSGLYTRDKEPIRLPRTSIPFMSPATQKRYKRSFSPFRTNEAVSPFIASDAPNETSIRIIPPELSKSSTAVLTTNNQNYSENLSGSARKGILKSLSKEEKKGADSTAEAQQEASDRAEEKSDLVKPEDAAKEERSIPVSYPDIEIVLGPSVDAKPMTPAVNVSSVSKRVTLAPKEQSPTPKRHEIAPTPSPVNSHLSATEKAAAATKALPLIPLFHGLEVGRHREPLTANYTLSDYIKEQSLAAYGHNQQVDLDAKVDKKVDKEVKGWRKSFKRKSKKDRKDQKKERLEEHPTFSPIQETVTYSAKTLDSKKYTIMVDKQIQTSTWLINSLTSKKTPKLKRKSQSMKKHKRRDSVVSDTFMPSEPPKYKEAYQRSSLGDLRKTAEVNPVGIVAFSPAGAAASSGGSNGILRPRPVVPGSSSAMEAIKPDPATSSPKPKKLSLTAVILLKNRLARFREKKRKEKSHKQIAEVATGDFHGDAMVSIENELNLSKLEISKETDIIDDIFESEFPLDYPKKHIRFESLPSEPMQSEEPLPPLSSSSSRRMRQRRESTMRERKRKCIQYCKKFIAFLFSHIGLCSLVVAYTILGGFIFRELEKKTDNDVRGTIATKRFKVVGQLVSMAADMRRTEEGLANFTDEVNNTILDYQSFIHQQTKERGWDGKEGAEEDGPWTYASALLYAITVTTTIGYGHVAPKTPEGRIVTIAYAVVGIPLTLLCLTNIGDVMATGFRLLYGKVCCGVCCTMFKPRRRRMHVDIEKGLGHPLVTTEEEEPDKPKEVIHVPTSLCLLLIAAYICSGAWLFSSWEQWDYLTAAYFCFITLSTIGFGDIVPGMDNNAWAQEEKLVLCALYLVLGLSLIAMCFNLVQEDVKVKCRWLGMKLGLVEKPQAPI